MTEIYVNGTPHRYNAGNIHRGVVCWMASMPDTASVTYKSADGTISGILSDGKLLDVTPGMRFDCHRTGAA